jgi:hypothetical protein
VQGDLVERGPHLWLPRTEAPGISHRGLELGVDLPKAQLDQREVGPRVGRARARKKRLAQVRRGLLEVRGRERAGARQPQGIALVPPCERFCERRVVRLQLERPLELAPSALPVSRSGRFPSLIEPRQLVAGGKHAQVREAARCGERREHAKRRKRCNCRRESPLQLGLAGGPVVTGAGGISVEPPPLPAPDGPLVVGPVVAVPAGADAGADAMA